MPLAINALAFFVLYGTQFITAQYFQLVLVLSPLEAGLATIPGTLGYLLGSFVGPLIANRLSTAYAMSGSLVLTAAGFGMLTQAAAGGLWVVVSGSVVFSLGLAPVYVLATDLTVSAAPPDQAGSASALLETGAELGGALGIAGLGSTVVAVYRHALPPAAPSEVPQPAWDSARRTLGGATAAAEQLPRRAGAEMLESARVAFLQGFRVAEVIGTSLLAVAAVAALLVLRRGDATRDSDTLDAATAEVAPSAAQTPTPYNATP